MSIDTPIWLPGVTRLTPQRTGGLPSQRRLRNKPAKGTVHSTETAPGTARAVAKNLGWPYSVLADPYTKRVYHLLPLNYTALSLRGTHSTTKAKIETNHAGVMHPQVSLIGYSAQLANLTYDQLDWLVDEVFGPIAELCGIPNKWAKTYNAGQGIVLARADSPIRLSLDECHDWNGWLFHQTWHGQDHWDCPLDTEYIAARLNGGTPIPDTTENTPMPNIFNKPAGMVIRSSGGYNNYAELLQAELNKWFNETLAVDGHFGQLTTDAVIRSQRLMKFSASDADGLWGDQSHSSLEQWSRDIAAALVAGFGGSTPPPPPPPPPPPASPPPPPAPESVNFDEYIEGLAYASESMRLTAKTLRTEAKELDARADHLEALTDL